MRLATGLFCIAALYHQRIPLELIRKYRFPLTGKSDEISSAERSLTFVKAARLALGRADIGEDREAMHCARSVGRRQRLTSARSNTLGNSFQDAVGYPRQLWNGHALNILQRTMVRSNTVSPCKSQVEAVIGNTH